MAWVIFSKFMENQEDGGAINLDGGGDTLKCMLVDDTRAPVGATDESIEDIDDNEVAGAGYSSGGAALANQSITMTTDGATVTFDCDNITWSQDTGGFSTARYAILLKETGTPADDRVICYADLGGNKGNVDGDLTIEMNAAGIFTKTKS